MGWITFTLSQLVLTSVTLGALKKNGTIQYVPTEGSALPQIAGTPTSRLFLQSELEGYQE